MVPCGSGGDGLEVEGDGAGGRAFVEVFEEEAVAVVIGVLVDLDGGIGVGGRDADAPGFETAEAGGEERERVGLAGGCLLYTSDAADE